MKQFRIQLLPEALSEFEDAFSWYAQRSQLAAESFRTAVFEKVDALEHEADMWPRDHDGIHYSALNRFPYTLHFEIEGSTVTVLAIAHHRRRPSFWKARLPTDPED